MSEPEKILFYKQTRKNIIGLGICLILFITGFVIPGNIAIYLNLSGLMIVIGGTLGAAFLGYHMNRIEILLKVLKTAYGSETIAPEEVVKILVKLSVRRKLKGVLALQADEDQTTIAFLKQAIGLFVDGCSKEQIKDTLSAEMYFFRMRRDGTLRVLQTMADVSPCFGLVGSVVGIIGMLAGGGDPVVIMKTIPVALTSTLYGLIFTNFLFLPFEAKIRERTVKELFLQKIITEGILAISDELHPRLLGRKLNSFLTPSDRHRFFVSLKKEKNEIQVETLRETA